MDFWVGSFSALDRKQARARIPTGIQAARVHLLNTCRIPVAADQAVLVPGDPEWKLEDDRRVQGIPLLPSVVEDLNNLAGELSMSPFSEVSFS